MSKLFLKKGSISPPLVEVSSQYKTYLVRDTYSYAEQM